MRQVTYISIKVAMEKLSPYTPCTQPTLNRFCMEGTVPCRKNDKGCWEIEKTYIDAAINWRTQAFEMDTYLNSKEEYTILTEKEKVNCRRVVVRKTAEFRSKSEYTKLFSGCFADADADKMKAVVDMEVEAYISMNRLLPIKEAAKELGVSTYILKQKVQDGEIKAQTIKNAFFIEKGEIEAFRASRNSFVGVADCIQEVSDEMKDTIVFDMENQGHRGLLYERIRASEIGGYIVSREASGLKHGERRNAFYVPKTMEIKLKAIIREHLKDFGYKDNKLELFKKHKYWESHPETLKILTAFADKKIASGITALYEVLIMTDCPEITRCTDDEIMKLVEYVNNNAPTKIYAMYLAMFLSYVRNNYPHLFSLDIRYDRSDETPKQINTEAYGINEYLYMAYMVFNDDFIKEMDIVAKALGSKELSSCWLYCIWHYVAAWRASDIADLPVIELPYDDEDMTERISAGNFAKEAEFISHLLQDKINNSNDKPNKTQDRQNSRFLVVVFPESLRTIIGTAYAIYNMHMRKNPKKILVHLIREYKALYGDYYTKVFGNKPFSNRKANKAFLDRIEENAEREAGTDNKVLGYRVASYARAHTEGIGQLSAITAKYLQTKLDGLTVDEVLMQLFETGACSFIPCMLFEIAYDKKFSELPVDMQTKILVQADINAHQAESAVVALQRAYWGSKEVVERIFSGYNPEEAKASAKTMLANVLNRNALAKHTDVSCLCAAMHVPCKCLDRENCLGCQYALYDKGILFYAFQTIRRECVKLAKAKTDGEKIKRRMLLEDEYLPAMIMILKHCKDIYGMDVEYYKAKLTELMTQYLIEEVD